MGWIYAVGIPQAKAPAKRHVKNRKASPRPSRVQHHSAAQFNESSSSAVSREGQASARVADVEFDARKHRSSQKFAKNVRLRLHQGF